MHSGEHRSPRFAAWGERLWRRPLPYAIGAVVALVALAVPVLSLDTGMPSIKDVPEQDGSQIGYTVQQTFVPGATGPLQIVTSQADAAVVSAAVEADPGIARIMPAQPGADGRSLVLAVPTTDPSADGMGATVDRLRDRLPAGALVGGPAVENHDLEAALAAKTPLVIGVVLGLGFLLLLVALRAPVIAAVGVVTNLLATGAAFGVARLIFQDGHLAPACSASSRRVSWTPGDRCSSSR